MPWSPDYRAPDREAVLPDRPLRKGSDVVLAAMAFIACSLTGLVSCAGWGVRPESAVIIAPADEVWNATLELLRDREFKIDQQDNNTRDLRATKEIVLRTVTDRATPTTQQKIRHQIDLSVRASGDGRSVIEVIYRIDKVVEDNEAFHFLDTVRDRIAISKRSAPPIPPR